MSTNEIMVGIVCLLLGYWVIGAVLSGNKPPADAEKNTPDEASNASQNDRAGPGGQQNGGNPTAGTKSQTWFEVLGVSRTATLDEVQTAYRSLIRQYHPDKVANLGEELRELAEKKSKDINQAYNDALVACGGRN